MAFVKAVKHAAKARASLIGPAGSGKSWTSLLLARLLAGPNGKIAAVDTEHGSLSKYADIFDFDVIELDSFHPTVFQSCLKDAEAAKYDVFLVDSLSHFWMGKDGALEFVDMAGKRRGGDSFSGWKDFRPHERAMVDLMVASPCHVITTMRTKTDYVEEINDKGKKVRKKVGLAPVQREGLEYEFDLVAYMDEDNTLIVDKTRCPFYTSKAFTKPSAETFQPFVTWLQGVERAERPVTAAEVAAKANGQQKPAPAPSAPSAPSAPPPPTPEFPAALQAMFDALTADPKNGFANGVNSLLAKLDAKIGTDAAEEAYVRIQLAHGVDAQHPIEKRSQAARILKDLFYLEEKTPSPPPPPPAEDPTTDDQPFAATDADLPPLLQGSAA